MTNALSAFIREQMSSRGLRNRDVEQLSGLSRQLVSRYVNDERQTLTRLPDKVTITGFATALNVSPEFLLGKAVQALGLGYSTGDFVNDVATASDEELVEELRRRLTEHASERNRAHTELRPDGGTTDDDLLSTRTAARTGISSGRALRRHQDEAASGPDPEGSEPA